MNFDTDAVERLDLPTTGYDISFRGQVMNRSTGTIHPVPSDEAIDAVRERYQFGSIYLLTGIPPP